MPLQEYFCLSERSIHDSYLCLANVSSFLCLYFCLCKKTRGLRANQKHNKIMHISMWAVIRVVLEPWSQPLLCSLQLREGFGYKGDNSCCSLWLAQGHQSNFTPCSQTQVSCIFYSAFSANHVSPSSGHQILALEPEKLWADAVVSCPLQELLCRSCAWLVLLTNIRYCYLFSLGYQMKSFPFHLAA